MNKKFLNIALFAVYDFISTLISVVLTFLVLSINPEIKLPWVWNSNLFYLCVSPFLVVFFFVIALIIQMIIPIGRHIPPNINKINPISAIVLKFGNK